MVFAGQAQAVVDGVEVFHRGAPAHGHVAEQLARQAVHGVNVGEVDHRGLVAQMFQRGVDQIEVDALHEQVARDEQVAVVVAEHGAVVAHAAQGRGVAGREALREVTDEAKLAERGYFGS